MSTPENAAIPPIDEPQTSPEKAVWNPITRIAFRFAFAYFGMYAFPLFAGYIPGIAWFADLWIRMWHVMVPWVGAHVLHLSQPITYFVTGSGDTTADWVLTLCQLTIAMGATVIWSVLDRRRASYVKLHEWLRLGLRFALGAVLIWYAPRKSFQFNLGLQITSDYWNAMAIVLPWDFCGRLSGFRRLTQFSPAWWNLLAVSWSSFRGSPRSEHSSAQQP